jgi:DNA-directed RNA polymerase II subunit RPB2
MDIGFTIISKFFKENPNFLVDHHLESYNRFVNHDIHQLITQNNPISFNKNLVKLEGEDVAIHSCDIYIGGKKGDFIRFAKPILHENGVNNYLYPNIARLQNLTYAFSIIVDIEFEFKINNKVNEETVVMKDVFFGNIPIMIQSHMCVLHGMPPDVRFNMGECKIDPGGYFIIDGSEKTIISQERFANNILRLSKTPKQETYSYIAEIRSESEDESKPVRETKVRMMSYQDEENINLKEDEMKRITQTVKQQIVVDIPNINMPIPLFIVFRALGIISDKDIIKMCVPDDDPVMMELLRPSIYDAGKIYTQQMAIKYMAPFSKYLSDYHVYFILCDYFLPHINSLTDERHFSYDLLEKAHFLGYMVNKILRLSINLDVQTDRDSFQFKRVEPSGVLLSDLFKEFYKSQIKDIIRSLDIAHNEHEGTYNEDSKAFQEFVVSTLPPIMSKKRITEKGIHSGFKGDWGSEIYTKRIGLSQELNRLTYSTAISLMRKCVMQMDDNSVVLGPRYLHATQWGMMCPVDSDGGDVGTHKQFSICTKISTGTSKKEILELLQSYKEPIHCIPIVDSRPELLYMYTKIFVNGHWKYSTTTPQEIVIDIKHKRRIGKVNKWISISFNIRENVIYIYTDEGRVYRPVLYINEDKEVSFSKKDEKLSWEELIQGTSEHPSSIEYIDCEESNTALISINHLSEYENTNFTHVEIHPSLILGYMGLQIIFLEHSPLPRNAFSCGQSRQAVSVYSTNYQNRMDKTGLVLNYGQIPLIKSYYFQHLNQEYIPYGVNAIVAIMSYTGYNVEDAILINKSSLERGMFNTSYFSVYEETEDEEKKIFFAPNEELPQFDDNGIIRTQTVIDNKTPIINMSINSKTRQIYTKRDQQGYVDKTYMTTNALGHRTVKIRICDERIPNIGDKFASRAGQKGTCGIVLPETDMPFNDQGIRPDLIINPHALPSRMTLGQLIESLIGKVHLQHGSYGDCTAFNKKTDVEFYGDKLREYDFHSKGIEIMYNGMTGEAIKTDIYIGPTYYMRLKHIVKDKINFRERGPMTGLTRQPVQGRSNEGGLRIGEMERDGVIANGLNMFETESMMLRGDGTYIDSENHTRKPYRLTVDNVTGLIAIVSKNSIYSPTIDGPMEITDQGIQSNPKYEKRTSTINVPYAFKLFMQEIGSMNIQMRIITSDNVNHFDSMGWTPLKTKFDKVLETQGFTLVGKLIQDFKPNSLFVSNSAADPCSDFDYMLHTNAPLIINNRSMKFDVSRRKLDVTLFPCIYDNKGKNDLLAVSTIIHPKLTPFTKYCKNKLNLEIYEFTEGRAAIYNYNTSNPKTEYELHKAKTVDELVTNPCHVAVNYMFQHLKTGIFVRIKDNKVVNFNLMYNTEFKNNFYTELHVETEPGNKEYVSIVENPAALDKFLKSTQIKKHRKPENWYANNCLLRTELNDMNPTDNYLSDMYDMFVNTCNQRVVNDCVFILNRKDFPHLHKRWIEPFSDLFGRYVALPDPYFHNQFVPILSQSTHSDYADVPIPTGDDLNIIGRGETSKFFATYSYTNNDTKKYDRVRCDNESDNIDVSTLPEWKDRATKFIWRGQSTGCGVDEVTNPRIMLENKCKDPDYVNRDFMNVKITRITKRIKTKLVKIGGGMKPVLSFIPPQLIEDDAKVPMKNQVGNKFIFNIQGNSAAYRFGSLLRYGCCVINIKCPYTLWFEPFLKTQSITEKNKADIDTSEFHCLTIENNFSNFETTIQWCIDNDAKCEQIAKNGQAFYNEHFTNEFIYDYMADVLNGVSNTLAKSENAKFTLKKHEENVKNLYKQYTIRNNFPLFKEDVKYEDDCDLSDTIIIVPFRDDGDQGRGKQLEKFVEHYSAHKSIQILVVEQSNDGRKFNRGALLNAGYLFALEHYPHINTFLFHDVDIIMPPDIVNRYYGNCDDYRILHLGNLVKDMDYNPPFGRVIRFSKKAFKEINGFPNNFYGWGGEDDALAFRIHMNGISVHRPHKSEGTPGMELETENDVKKIEDPELKKSKIEMHKWENICADRQIWKINGVNSLQFKTSLHKELKSNAHFITIDLTPKPTVTDLFHSMFKNPTEENAYYYQESYKHLSSSVEWGTLSMEEKQKQLEEDIKLMKDKKLFDTYKEQEKQKEKEEEKEKEKERLRMSPPSYLKDDPSISPPFVVDTPTDLPPDIDLIPSQEISEMRERLDQRDEDEELTEENLEGGGITILNNIAKDETDPTKNLKQVKYDAKD